MRRYLWLGTLGGVLGAIIGTVVVAIDVRDEDTSNSGGSAFVETLVTVWKPVFGTQTLDDGRIFFDVGFAPETREHTNGVEIDAWADLACARARKIGPGAAIDVVKIAPSDVSKGSAILDLIPMLLEYSLAAEYRVWESSPPPPLDEDELRELQRQFPEYDGYLPTEEAPDPDAPARLLDPHTDTTIPVFLTALRFQEDGDNGDDGERTLSPIAPDEFGLRGRARAAEALAELVSQANSLDDVEVRATTLARLATIQYDSEHPWLNNSATETDALAYLAADELNSRDAHLLLSRLFWPFMLAVLGFAATSLSAPILEAVGTVVGRRVAGALQQSAIEAHLTPKAQR